MPVRYLSDSELARLSSWQDESDVAPASRHRLTNPARSPKHPDPFRCYGDPLFGAITGTLTTVRIRIQPLSLPAHCRRGHRGGQCSGAGASRRPRTESVSILLVSVGLMKQLVT